MAKEPTDRPLVILSNRLPVTVKRAHGELKVEPSSGGLVAAMQPAMQSRGGTWVGWPGGRIRPGESIADADDRFALAPVELSTTEVRRYYSGFSNRTLWPLFHSLPERTEFDRRDWETYEAVNRRFAEAAAEVTGDNELVWIHDYHLVRAAAHLRQLRPDARIAFFLHIPFPPYDLYRILPWYRELLLGLLACDLVGFHSPGYVTNFLDCVERLLGERVDRLTNQVEHGQRTVQVGAYPLGIDYGNQEAAARKASRQRDRGPERILLGVDRLDYTKGIPERIRAFERLLELYPEHCEKVVLIQVAVPSRAQVAEYQALKREIDELVGHVNGKFGTSTWTPIRYLYRSISSDALASLYRDADVAVVTPLRDGMNLVAKEFVASRVDEPGVLVLSRMAGAAETMHEAMQVNPYNADSVANILHRALTLGRDDRLARMRALQRRERRHDLYRWLDDFLADAGERQSELEPVTNADFDRWLGAFIRDWPVALFLDYDGTVAEIASHPTEATLPDETRALIEACVSRSDTDVAVISGRALDDVRQMVGIEGVLYAGNHGIEIQGPGMDPFLHPDATHYRERATELAASLREIGQKGAWVEEKGASLTYHFRNAAPDRHEALAAEAWSVIRESGFQPRDARCAVEARPPLGWDKGHAVLRILRERYGASWSEDHRVIYVGDDETDEDAFRSLQGLGATFRVGPAENPSLAGRRLRDVPAVLAMLRWVAERPGR